jgi:hypothetical protein
VKQRHMIVTVVGEPRYINLKLRNPIEPKPDTVTMSLKYTPVEEIPKVSKEVRRRVVRVAERPYLHHLDSSKVGQILQNWQIQIHLLSEGTTTPACPRYQR